MECLITFDNVSYVYPQDEENTRVLDGVSLNIYDGDFVAVIGHNGSGKSTLAKHMNTILQPAEGTVTVQGIDTTPEENWLAVRRLVGMVFQNPDNQLVATVVEEDVAFGLENLGVPQPDIRRRVDDALREVGMYEYREHAPHRLSGGQKQRVAIAGVLAMEPRVLVLDEPTAMLDPVGRREVLQTVRKLNRERGIGVVLITHHMSEAADADRVLVMDHGKIVLDGAPRDIFSQVETLNRLGLAVPQTTELLYELRKHGFELPFNLLELEPCAQAIQNAWVNAPNPPAD